MNKYILYACRFIVISCCGVVPFSLYSFGYVSGDMAFSWVTAMFLIAAVLNIRTMTKKPEITFEAVDDGTN